MNLQVSQRCLPRGDLLKQGRLGGSRRSHVEMEEIQDSLCEEPEKCGADVVVAGHKRLLAETESLGDDDNEETDCQQLQDRAKEAHPEKRKEPVERLANDPQDQSSKHQVECQHC